MDGFQIRKYNGTDTAVVQNFLKSIFLDLSYSFDLSDKDNDLEHIQEIYGREKCGFWLLLEMEKIVGTIALRDMKDGEYELKRFFIEPSSRGKGYGQRALQYVLDYSRQQDIKAIKLDVARNALSAIHLYEKFGFREIPSHGKGDAKEQIWMELRF